MSSESRVVSCGRMDGRTAGRADRRTEVETRRSQQSLLVILQSPLETTGEY
jgi:hypothetical protein